MQIKNQCAYCKADISPGNLVQCTTCKAPHHALCWNEAGGCTIFQCAGKSFKFPFPETATPTPKRKPQQSTPLPTRKPQKASSRIEKRIQKEANARSWTAGCGAWFVTMMVTIFIGPVFFAVNDLRLEELTDTAGNLLVFIVFGAPTAVAIIYRNLRIPAIRKEVRQEEEEKRALRMKKREKKIKAKKSEVKKKEVRQEEEEERAFNMDEWGEKLKAMKSEAKKKEERDNEAVFKLLDEKNCRELVKNFAAKKKNEIESRIIPLDNPAAAAALIVAGYQDEDIEKLRELLKTKGVCLSMANLLRVLQEEVRNQSLEEVRGKIEIGNPTCPEDYIRNLIEVFGDDWASYKRQLEQLLLEKGFQVSREEIQETGSNIVRQIELAHFEKTLQSDGEKVSLADIDELSGIEFEGFLSDLFSKMGYRVEETKATGDQGADLVVSKLGETISVQAKRYTGSVGNSAVQEVVASIPHYKANRGMVVTTGTFTSSAVELAKSNNVELWDRDRLKKAIDQYL